MGVHAHKLDQGLLLDLVQEPLRASAVAAGGQEGRSRVADRAGETGGRMHHDTWGVRKVAVCGGLACAVGWRVQLCARVAHAQLHTQPTKQTAAAPMHLLCQPRPCASAHTQCNAHKLMSPAGVCCGCRTWRTPGPWTRRHAPADWARMRSPQHARYLVDARASFTGPSDG